MMLPAALARLMVPLRQHRTGRPPQIGLLAIVLLNTAPALPAATYEIDHLQLPHLAISVVLQVGVMHVFWHVAYGWRARQSEVLALWRGLSICLIGALTHSAIGAVIASALEPSAAHSPTSEFPPRLVFWTLFYIFWGPCCGYLSRLLDRTRRAHHDRARAEFELEQGLTDAEQRRRATRLELRHRLRQVVRPQLQRTTAQLQTSFDDAPLDVIASDLARLSADLTAPLLPTPLHRSQSPQRIKWRDIIAAPLDRPILSFVAAHVSVGIFSCIVVLPQASDYLLVQTLETALETSVLALLLTVTSFLAHRRYSKVNLRQYLISVLACTFVGIETVQLFVSPPSPRFELLIAGFIAMRITAAVSGCALGAVLAANTAQVCQAEEFRHALAALQDDLAADVERLNSRVHSSIQSRLASAAMALHFHVDGFQIDDIEYAVLQQLEQVAAQLDELIVELRSP